MSAAFIMDLDGCLCCTTQRPLPGQELCKTCHAALLHCVPTMTVGKCLVCQDWADLYMSDYMPREWVGCLTHAVLATVRQIPLTDTCRSGDPRNIA